MSINKGAVYLYGEGEKWLKRAKKILTTAGYKIAPDKESAALILLSSTEAGGGKVIESLPEHLRGKAILLSKRPPDEKLHRDATDRYGYRDVRQRPGDKEAILNLVREFLS